MKCLFRHSWRRWIVHSAIGALYLLGCAALIGFIRRRWFGVEALGAMHFDDHDKTLLTLAGVGAAIDRRASDHRRGTLHGSGNCIHDDSQCTAGSAGRSWLGAGGSGSILSGTAGSALLEESAMKVTIFNQKSEL